MANDVCFFCLDVSCLEGKSLVYDIIPLHTQTYLELQKTVPKETTRGGAWGSPVPPDIQLFLNNKRDEASLKATEAEKYQR